MKMGRAYPSVLDPVTGEKAQGALAITAMPKQVRNALICHPSPVLVDLDLVKCYPSIMVALARMWEIRPHRYQLLSAFVRRPKELCERVAQEMGEGFSKAKDIINQIISDPEQRYLPRHGLCLVLRLRCMLLRKEIVARHHLVAQYWSTPRADKRPPNTGVVVHRVITDYEVRAIAVAVQVLSGMGIQVCCMCTYEYI